MSNIPTFSDLQKMTIDQLRILNKDVVYLINERVRMETTKKCMAFKPGDVVTFKSSKDGRKVRMIAMRINAKTITGNEIDGHNKITGRQWRVSPGLLIRE